MTQNPYANFTTSEDLEIHGLWIEEPAFRVKIARSGGKNKAYSKAIESLFRTHRRSIKMGTVSEEVVNPLLAEAFVRTIIKGWQVVVPDETDDAREPVYADGIHDPETGDVVAVTPENIKRVLLDPKFGKDLFTYIREQADNAAIFLEDVKVTDTKN